MRITNRFPLENAMETSLKIDDDEFIIIPGFIDNQVIIIYENEKKRDMPCIYYITFEPSEMRLMTTFVGKDMMMKRIIESIRFEEENADETTPPKHAKIQMYKTGKDDE